MLFSKIKNFLTGLGRRVPPRTEPMGAIFSRIYSKDVWSSGESLSGSGSDLGQTKVLRQELPKLFSRLGIKSALDIPCGDSNWMRHTALGDVDYLGADVVPEMINANRERFGGSNRRFMLLDITKDDLPQVDLVMCRDLFVHFSFADIFAALENIKRSGSEYLLATTFTGRRVNYDRQTGLWRALNLQEPPLNFPNPLEIINEECTEEDGAWKDKSMGLWRIQDIANSLAETPERPLARPVKRSGEERRVLLLSYAFPPVQVPMTPAVVKPMAGLGAHGYTVDVLSAEPFSKLLQTDDSLLAYAEQNFASIRLLPPSPRLLDGIRPHWEFLSNEIPDLMHCLNGKVFDALMEMDLSRYRAIITWSPFHSVNTVMVRLKARHPNITWIAQFSDPWARNPLEPSRLREMWNRWQEAKTIKAADYIVHTSATARKLMFRSVGPERWARSAVVPHCFDASLYPQRPRARNDRLTLRYIGVLFDRRSPEPFFLALAMLIKKRPELANKVVFEIVGSVQPSMLETTAARSLPDGMVQATGQVDYLQSLELMYDADLLVLIEADIQLNLFMSSKVSDYVGSGTPILGIVPEGATNDALAGLGWWRAYPKDVEGILENLENAINAIEAGTAQDRLDEDRRKVYSQTAVAARYVKIIESLS